MSEIIKKLAAEGIIIPSEIFTDLANHLNLITDDESYGSLGSNYRLAEFIGDNLGKLHGKKALTFKDPQLLQLETEVIILLLNNNGRQPITLRKLYMFVLYYAEYYFKYRFGHSIREFAKFAVICNSFMPPFFQNLIAPIVSKQDTNKPDLSEIDQEKLRTWLFNNEGNGFSFFTFLEAAHLVIRDLDKISGLMTNFQSLELLSKTDGVAGNYIIRFTPMGFISVDGNKDKVQKSNMDAFTVQTQPIFNQRLSEKTLGEILHEVNFRSFKTLYSKDGKKIGSTEELFPAKKDPSTSSTSSKSVLTFKAAFDPIAWRI